MVLKDEVTVVIPTLNEREGIEMVINEVKGCGYTNILVVDGYSSDGTAEIAAKNGAKVSMQHGKGKASAIKTAIELVSTKYILVLDGDGTYDPKDSEKLLYHMGNYDEVIGARLHGRENIPRINRLGNWLITKTFNLLLGANLGDVCSGMYMLRTEAAKALELNSDGFDVEVEIASQIVTNGRLTEVPVSYRKRRGKQKLSALKHGPRILQSVVNMGRINNPVFLFASLATLFIIPGFFLLMWAISDFLVFGVYQEYCLIGAIVLFLFAAQAFTISTISLLLKRMERRLIRRFEGQS